MTKIDRGLKAAYTKWEKQCRGKFLKDHPERRKQYKNDLGYELKALYTPLDLEKRGFSYEKDCGFPGEHPFVRGHTPNMNRSDNVHVGCYSGFGTAEDSRERYEKIVSWGADKLEMAWDLPTQVGYDSDHIMATGEVGRTGVAIDTLKDIEDLFANITLDQLRGVTALANSIGPIGLGLLIALGEKQGLKTDEYRVFMQNDPLKEYTARGTYIYPIKDSVKLACDVVEWCINNAPHWKPITFCCNHLNAAGAGSVNAVAFAMAHGFVYIDELISRGYTIEQIAPLCRFFLDEREDFFVMAALGRCARKVWSEKIQERYGVAIDSNALQIDFTCYSHGGETLQEPINNILRIGLSALGYYLGGATYVYNAGYDEAMGLTSEETCKVSIRTSQIINNELGFSKTIDPLAGSYYVESLTMDMARDIRAQLDKIEKDYDGVVGAIEAGYLQRVISQGAMRRQTEFETGERVFTGLNIYKTDEDLPDGTFQIDPAIERNQRKRLKRVKDSRDSLKVAETLENLRKATLSNMNVVDCVVDALRAYATVGEICDVWREVYGEYRSETRF